MTTSKSPFMSGDNSIQWAFAGGKEHGLAVLKALEETGFRPFLIAAPETFSEADRQAMGDYAEERKTDFAVSRTMEEMTERLRALDLLLVCRFELLPEAVFSAPGLGAVNLHPSLLPKYRGVHPLSWALIDGETETGVTAHVIDQGIDSGPVLVQKSFPITDDDDIWTLTDKSARLSGEVAVELFRHIAETNTLPEIKSIAGPSSYARRRTPGDGRIDWRQTSRRIFNLVRALRPPLPPAFTQLNGETVSILDCALPVEAASGDAVPGTVLDRLSDGRARIKTGDGEVTVKIESPIKKGDRLG